MASMPSSTVNSEGMMDGAGMSCAPSGRVLPQGRRVRPVKREGQAWGQASPRRRKNEKLHCSRDSMLNSNVRLGISYRIRPARPLGNS